jgi:secondary thiamine-phosphate synthase enzyme
MSSTTLMKTLSVKTAARNQMVDVTGEVSRVIADSGVSSGICVVFCPHTTAGVTINENADPDVVSDIMGFTGGLIPRDAGFRHAEGNSDGHIKSSLFGPSLTLLVEKGRPVLGTWQGVYFCEFDGPRRRKLHVKVMGG